MPGALDIPARQGTVLDDLVIGPYKIDGIVQDLTGYLARMKVRRIPRDDPPLIAIDTDHVATDGTTILWVDRPGGKFKLNVAATTMAAIPPGTWVYDIELVPPDSPSGYDETKAFALLAGMFMVDAEVTWGD